MVSAFLRSRVSEELYCWDGTLRKKTCQLYAIPRVPIERDFTASCDKEACHGSAIMRFKCRSMCVPVLHRSLL